MEGIQGQLCRWLSDGLRSDDTYRDSYIHYPSCRKIRSITVLADSADAMADERCPYLDVFYFHILDEFHILFVQEVSFSQNDILLLVQDVFSEDPAGDEIVEIVSSDL